MQKIIRQKSTPIYDLKSKTSQKSKYIRQFPQLGIENQQNNQAKKLTPANLNGQTKTVLFLLRSATRNKARFHSLHSYST